MPIDTYNKYVDKITDQPLLQDWEWLRGEIKKYGLRHSSLVNHMPVESSSVRNGDTNGLYPIRRGVVVKTSGNTKLIFMPPEYERLKDRYQLAWDIDHDDLVEVYAIFQKFADQGISADVYHKYESGKDKKVSLRLRMHQFFYRQRVGLKSRYYSNTATGITETEQENACGFWRLHTMSNVFNTENTAWKEGKYPLFLGQAPALYDSVNVTYPKLFDLYKLQKSIDWAETEVSLAQSRNDMANSQGDARELMIENICYQWEADSIAARSIAVCFGPFITNSEYWAALLKISEIEVTHSLTYSEIVRQCIPDPTEIFERILKNEFLDDRMKTIGKIFHELKIAGAKYTLGLISDEEAYPIVMNGLVALFCLGTPTVYGQFCDYIWCH